MTNIDGSMGEGGGQILRTSMALAALLDEEITITNIRANRSKKGLRPQHVAAVRAIAELCGGELEGAFPGSETLTYRPGHSELQDYNIEIGTAGSISLVLQACMLAVLHKPKMHLTISGGTNVYYSPSIDYCEYVVLPFLERMGYRSTLNNVVRGFHPQGGGLVDITLCPGPLKPLDLRTRGKLIDKGGVCYIQNLPYKIGEKLKAASGADIIESTNGVSDGAGVFLYTEYSNTIFGVDALGRKGLSSENVGAMGIEAMNKEISSNATLDFFAADQLLPYMCLADGTSYFRVRKLSNHLRTQMDLLTIFLEVEFKVTEIDNCLEISVSPAARNQ
ncbi:RNA 3'-terminal phosphate cyclase [Candidatus Methanomassiliicoccus intestinalis]|mgnify:FL=1|uniref:RNA 3'-terminal phosphate cyclase n=1 Tax=Candidatus Methanomassiliicoccus intestinalis TaxID=1406512 RepID=UPI0037DCBEE1